MHTNVETLEELIELPEFQTNLLSARILKIRTALFLGHNPR